MKNAFILFVGLLFIALCVVFTYSAIEYKSKDAWKTSLFCLFASAVLLWMTNIGDEKEEEDD